MYKLSELTGKPVLSLLNASFIGTTANVCFDSALKKATVIKIFSPSEESVYIPFGALKDTFFDVATVNKYSPLLSPVFENNPIGKPAFARNGKYLGKITDVMLSDDTVTALHIDGVPTKMRLLRYGEVLLFGKNKKEKTSKYHKDKTL